MMVKIGVILMLFSNPTCHFKDTADFTRLKATYLAPVYILYVMLYSKILTLVVVLNPRCTLLLHLVLKTPPLLDHLPTFSCQRK